MPHPSLFIFQQHELSGGRSFNWNHSCSVVWSNCDWTCSMRRIDSDDGVRQSEYSEGALQKTLAYGQATHDEYFQLIVLIVRNGCIIECTWREPSAQKFPNHSSFPSTHQPRVRVGKLPSQLGRRSRLFPRSGWSSMCRRSAPGQLYWRGCAKDDRVLYTAQSM